MILACATCHVAVSNPIQELTDRSSLSDVDEQPHLPVGFYYVAGHPDDEDRRRTAGDYVLNIADLTNTRHHHLPSRANGCCGLDGCDGFNTLCLNGHEIGTEYSDCWMPHFVVLAAAHVIPLDQPALP